MNVPRPFDYDSIPDLSEFISKYPDFGFFVKRYFEEMGGYSFKGKESLYLLKIELINHFLGSFLLTLNIFASSKSEHIGSELIESLKEGSIDFHKFILAIPEELWQLYYESYAFTSSLESVKSDYINCSKIIEDVFTKEDPMNLDANRNIEFRNSIQKLLDLSRVKPK